MTPKQRIENYNTHSGFPEALFLAGDNRIVGTFIMGNDYRIKTAYYGGYPPTYLKRIKALFPDKKRVLHLFSGKVDTEEMPGQTVDVLPALDPDYVDDAQTLLNVPVEQYDLVLADPPYSIEDANHYGVSMIKRNKVMAALERLPKGAHVCWLDQVWPMYKKTQFSVEGAVGILKSTNHRVRMLIIFRRNDPHRLRLVR